MKTDFVHLNLHSGYSLLRGAGRIGEIVNYAGEMGLETLALTDTNGLYGAVEFYRAAKAAGALQRPDWPDVRKTVRIEAGRVVWDDGYSIPIEPMLGVVGVAPPAGHVAERRPA